jgi:hypothetical protein
MKSIHHQKAERDERPLKFDMLLKPDEIASPKPIVAPDVARA